MKTLVAVDGGACTEHVIRFLASRMPWLGADEPVTVMHCAEALPPRAAVAFDAEALARYYEGESERVLAPVRSACAQAGIAATFVARVGEAAPEIARMAQEGGFDLLVMGSHGRGALASVVLGSVATQVLARCTTPVLIVR